MTLSELVRGLQHKLEVYGDLSEIRVRHSSGFSSVEVISSGCIDLDERVLYLGSNDEAELSEPCEFCGEKDCPA